MKQISTSTKSIVIISGANGFVGHYIARYFVSAGYSVIALSRQTASPIQSPESGIEWLSYDEFAALAERKKFKGACMVHCAARAHRLTERSGEVKNKYWRDNVDFTRLLVAQAIEGGVVKVIFLSTIKVLGEHTSGVAFSSGSTVNPQDIYAESKLAAEQHLECVSKKHGLPIISLRLPLVYGPGVKGNLQLLEKWLGKVYCVPFGSINNKRDMIGLGNLASVIHRCITKESEGYTALLVADGQPLSMTNICRLIKKHRGYRTFLMPVNTKLLDFFLSCIGKQSLSLRLLADLEVDISGTREFLEWGPPFSPDYEIKQWLLKSKEIK